MCTASADSLNRFEPPEEVTQVFDSVIPNKTFEQGAMENHRPCGCAVESQEPTVWSSLAKAPPQRADCTRLTAVQLKPFDFSWCRMHSLPNSRVYSPV